MNIYNNEKINKKIKLSLKLKIVYYEVITLLSFLKRKIQKYYLDN